ERQWYVAFGLAQLNKVDTAAMAAGLEDYEIKTEQTFVDAVLGILTGGIITARTVTVTK
ncbi:hypothetical protein HOK31_12085, partial [Candidatus Poribacteria bacterium]|nr:hypothetical protein [Candidatus Poribacteria bacterium]